MSSSENSTFTDSSHKIVIKTILIKETSIIFIVLLPIIFIVLFILFLLLLINYAEDNLKNTVRILCYVLIEYIAMPFLVIFLILNAFLLSISYFCCKSVIYISITNMCQFINKFFNKCKKVDGEIIQIKKVNVINDSKDHIMPTRADLYKDLDNTEHNTKFKKDQTNINLKIADNSSLNKRVKAKYLNSVQINKSKINEFLNKYLINEDNTPGYVNFIRNLNNNTMDDKNNSHIKPSDVISVKIKKEIINIIKL